MKIIAGKLGGRVFEAPRGAKTHPMSDKIRGALFNALGDIGGLTVLDAYAGSGALSFEAVSRGAASAIAVENDNSAQRIITKNIYDLNLASKVKTIKAGVGAWLSTSEVELFDIVLADPPYDKVQAQSLEQLATRAKPGGVIVLSLPPNSDFQLSGDGYQELSQKSYGDAILHFYRRII